MRLDYWDRPWWLRLGSSGVALLLAGSIAVIELDPEHHGDPHAHVEVVLSRTIDPSSTVVTGSGLPV
jgi:hypothetical protein